MTPQPCRLCLAQSPACDERSVCEYGRYVIAGALPRDEYVRWFDARRSWRGVELVREGVAREA